MTHPAQNASQARRPRPIALTAALTGAACISGLALTGPGTPTASAAETVAAMWISEYIEGSSRNKAIELYNASTVDINLSTVQVAIAYNGKSETKGFDLAGGVLAPGKTAVLVQEQASFVNSLPAGVPVTITGAGLWNGDDAVMVKVNGVVTDSLGQQGVDPGAAWSNGGVSTKDSTLRLRGGVCAGDTEPADAFNPAARYTSVGKDVFGGLGEFATNCPPLAPIPGGTPDPQPTVTPTATPTPTPTQTPDPEPTTPEPTTPTPTATVAPGNPGGDFSCDGAQVRIGAVQGEGDTTPFADREVIVRGVVTGDFQDGGINGVFIQDGGDGNYKTSDGIFVYGPSLTDLTAGQDVVVKATANEFKGQTQLSNPQVLVCGSAQLPWPKPVYPGLLNDTTGERTEGMLVQLPQSLHIIESYNYDRFGEVVLSPRRQFQPTALFAPGSTLAQWTAKLNERQRITLDDGRTAQNPDPARHPAGGVFALDNRFRLGDKLKNVTGVLDYRFGGWRIQPTAPATHIVSNPRPQAPQVGGDVQVASFNVLNYFTTFGRRGADNAEEFARQEAKIVAALAELDADVVGLMEIENNGTAVATLADAVNAKLGSRVYEPLVTGRVGTDEIAVAMLYKPSVVSPVGAHAVLDSRVDSRFIDTKNRPVIAQTFRDNASGEAFTVAVNHLKSKGSSCESIGDPTDPNGQGNCNGVRTQAARALSDWLATNPTGQASRGNLIIGDLNAYDKEDPIMALTGSGYTDMVRVHEGERAYSYVFNGQLGYLDHALADARLKSAVTDVQTWHANADEPDLLDYDTTYKKPAQDAIYAPDAYRASDHDALVVGLDF